MRRWVDGPRLEARDDRGEIGLDPLRERPGQVELGPRSDVGRPCARSARPVGSEPLTRARRREDPNGHPLAEIELLRASDRERHDRALRCAGR